MFISPARIAAHRICRRPTALGLPDTTLGRRGLVRSLPSLSVRMESWRAGTRSGCRIYPVWQPGPRQGSSKGAVEISRLPGFHPGEDGVRFWWRNQDPLSPVQCAGAVSTCARGLRLSQGCCHLTAFCRYGLLLEQGYRCLCLVGAARSPGLASLQSLRVTS